ncbi:hypothetical protein N7541_007854 [Penicillium brevicompactum]|uniref:Nuclease PA3 n=1 Tax=Penicillium brevicompactum TaxID=5074 RepID=A0A9W9UMA0_PENBR|nr:hypothetical protein N7541_007854 [Penicillium brevicompactum]
MVAISKIAIASGFAHGAHAWGVLGHATVAYVAQHYLSESTASWAKEVLDDSSSSYLANIASWADEYRLTSAGKWSAPLHYIDAEDNPPTTCNVDYARDCGDSGCSVSAIANYTQRVGDARLTANNTAEALKFLVHFLGDITQPLHDEAYEVGGNGIDVTFNGYSDNLHSDWDTYMPEMLVGGDSLADAQSWADLLVEEIEDGDYKAEAASWIKGDTIGDAVSSATRWAADGNALTGDLYPTYYNSAIGTIELQIAKGGYRLANWLNLIYSTKIAKRDLERFVEVSRNEAPELELRGRNFLPESRPLSRAKMAREAMEGSCCSSEKRGHVH